MNKSAVLTLSLILLTIACSSSGYNIFYGQNAYLDPGWGYYGMGKLCLSDDDVGVAHTIRGIYTTAQLPDFAAGLIHYYSDGGVCLIYLSQPLAAAEGSLVTVTGKLETREVEERERLLLVPEGLEEVENTDDLVRLVEREYGGLVDELEARITLRGSKLKLEREPQWVVMWVPAEEDFVILTATADLMYAAGVEFIIDGHSRQIEAVYANEWFKGE